MTLTALFHWIYLFLLILVFFFFFFAVAFPPFGNSDHVGVPVPIDFPSNSEGDATFHRAAYSCSFLIGMVFVII